MTHHPSKRIKVSHRGEHGGLYVSLGLLVLTGRLAGECVGPDKYIDKVTQKCHQCSEICDPVRDTQKECERECPDVYLKRIALKPTDEPSPLATHDKQTVQTWHIVVGGIICILIVVGIIVAIVAIKNKRRKRRKTRTSMIASESNCHSSARLAAGNGDYSLPRCNLYNNEHVPNEVVPTSPEENSGPFVASSNPQFRPWLGRHHSRSESDVVFPQCESETNVDEEDYRAAIATLDRKNPRSAARRQGLHELAPTEVERWRPPNHVSSSVRGSPYGSQGYQSSDPLYNIDQECARNLTLPFMGGMSDRETDLAEDSGTETPVKCVHDSAPVTDADVRRTLATDLADIDDIELGLLMNERR